MTAPNANAHERLREEILAEARREAESMIQQARQEAEALVAKAKTEAEQARQARQNAAQAEAARRADLILATVPVETARLRSTRIEALLQKVYATARSELEARRGPNWREMVLSLAADAIRRMSGNAFVVKLAPVDRAAVGDGLPQEIVRRVGRSPLNITIEDETSISGGGVLVEDVERRQVWDNRLSARLERMWPELRCQVAVQTGLISASATTGGSE